MSSLSTNPIAWFEIPVRDLERSQEFYQNILNLELEKNEMGPSKMLLFPCNEEKFGATGALIKADGYTPSDHGTSVYFEVEDIDKTLEKIKKNGGVCLTEKTSIGQHGFIAQFKDCEGNHVSLWSKAEV